MLLNPMPDTAPPASSSASSGSTPALATGSTHVSGTPSRVNRKCAPYSRRTLCPMLVCIICRVVSIAGNACSGEDTLKGPRILSLQVLLVHRRLISYQTAALLHTRSRDAQCLTSSWCTVPSCSRHGPAFLDRGRPAQRALLLALVLCAQNKECADDPPAVTSCTCTFFCMSWLARYCCSSLMHTRRVTLLWMHLFFGALQQIDRYRSGILGFLLWLHRAMALFLRFSMHPSYSPPNHRFDHAGLHHSDRGGPDHADAQRSCLGPKSQDCCRSTCYKMNPIRPALMWCLFLCLMNNGVVISEAAIDARVGFADHRSNPGATTCSTPCSGWAKQGEYRHIARPSQRQSHRETVRKRALLRAINRADRNPSGQTWYKGRLLNRTQLGPGLRCTTTAAPRQDASTTCRQRRLRLVS